MLYEIVTQTEKGWRMMKLLFRSASSCLNKDFTFPPSNLEMPPTPCSSNKSQTLELFADDILMEAPVGSTIFLNQGVRVLEEEEEEEAGIDEDESAGRTSYLNNDSIDGSPLKIEEESRKKHKTSDGEKVEDGADGVVNDDGGSSDSRFLEEDAAPPSRFLPSSINGGFVNAIGEDKNPGSSSIHLTGNKFTGPLIDDDSSSSSASGSFSVSGSIFRPENGTKLVQEMKGLPPKSASSPAKSSAAAVSSPAPAMAAATLPNPNSMHDPLMAPLQPPNPSGDFFPPSVSPSIPLDSLISR